MSTHQLRFQQHLPVSIHKAWDFLSSPANLEIITPPYMKFRIKHGFKTGDKMFEGMIITYSVKPVAGISMKWISEITKINAPYYFIDSQISGPYKTWIHKHILKETETGVEMTDELSYEVPMGFIGDLLNSIYIRKQLLGIFEFRRKKLAELFS